MMAEQVCNQRDYDKAIKFYKEALVYNENDSKVCRQSNYSKIGHRSNDGKVGQSCNCCTGNKNTPFWLVLIYFKEILRC